MLRHRHTWHPLLEHKRKHTNRTKHLNYPSTDIEDQTSILDNSEHKTQFVFITEKTRHNKQHLQNCKTKQTQNRTSYSTSLQNNCKDWPQTKQCLNTTLFPYVCHKLTNITFTDSKLTHIQTKDMRTQQSKTHKNINSRLSWLQHYWQQLVYFYQIQPQLPFRLLLHKHMLQPNYTRHPLATLAAIDHRQQP